MYEYNRTNCVPRGVSQSLVQTLAVIIHFVTDGRTDRQTELRYYCYRANHACMVRISYSNNTVIQSVCPSVRSSVCVCLSHWVLCACGQSVFNIRRQNNLRKWIFTDCISQKDNKNDVGLRRAWRRMRKTLHINFLLLSVEIIHVEKKLIWRVDEDLIIDRNETRNDCDNIGK